MRSFAAFSDIHYASYSSGITIDVCRCVERAFTEFCVSKKVDFAVFAGDRYLSHHPDDESRIAADIEQRYRNDCGIVTFSLVGNHDVWHKALSAGHSSRHLTAVWGDVLPNVIVMDEIRTYVHPQVPGVAVHAIPACIDWTDDLLDRFEFCDGYNLLVFHDLLEGSVLDNAGYKSLKGRKIAAIDDARFDFVVGGDVHEPQKLPFTKTRGVYVGATIQQSKRDRGGARGWLYVNGTDMDFVDSPIPKFLDVVWDLDRGLPNVMQVNKELAEAYEDTAEGNIVDVIFRGSRAQIEAVPANWHEDAGNVLGAFRMNSPVLRPKTASVNAAKIEAQHRTPVEDFGLFLGNACLAGIDPNRLLEKASAVLDIVK